MIFFLLYDACEWWRRRAIEEADIAYFEAKGKNAIYRPAQPLVKLQIRITTKKNLQFTEEI